MTATVCAHADAGVQEPHDQPRGIRGADTVRGMESGSLRVAHRDVPAPAEDEAWPNYQHATQALHDSARQLLDQLPNRDWISPDHLLRELAAPTDDTWLLIDTHANPDDLERFHALHRHVQNLARQHTQGPAEQVRRQLDFWGVNPADFHLDPRGESGQTLTPTLSGRLHDCTFVMWSDHDGVEVRIQTPENPIAQPPRLVSGTRRSAREHRWQHAGYQLVWGVRQYHEAAFCRHEHGGSDRCLWCRLIPPRFLVVETA